MERKPKLTDHHIFFYRQEWSLRPEARYLREDCGLRVMLERPLHDEMHNRVPLVPMLGVHALKRVAAEFVPDSNLYKNIDNFLLLTEEALRHPRSHEIEKKLGELTIESVLTQKEIIKEFHER